MKDYSKEILENALGGKGTERTEIVVGKAMAECASAFAQVMSPTDVGNVIFQMGGMMLLLNNLKHAFPEQYEFAEEYAALVQKNVKTIVVSVGDK